MLLKRMRWLLLLHTAVISFLVLPAAGYAATISVAGLANVAKGESTDAKRSVTSDALLGFGAGLFLEFEPTPSAGVFGVEPGLVYMQRNIGYGSTLTEKTTWVQVPILARLHFLGISLGAGPYLAHATGDIKEELGSTTATVTYSDAGVSTIDYGVIAALGFNIPVPFVAKPFVEGRYDIGLKNLSKSEGTTYKYKDMQVLLGLRF